MDDDQSLGERFDGKRLRLRAVAYRILGSLTEADAVVQEAWLRLQRFVAEDDWRCHSDHTARHAALRVA